MKLHMHRRMERRAVEASKRRGLQALRTGLLHHNVDPTRVPHTSRAIPEPTVMTGEPGQGGRRRRRRAGLKDWTGLEGPEGMAWHGMAWQEGWLLGGRGEEG